MRRLIAALCLACSLSTRVLAAHVEGDAVYRAKGRCFIPKGAAPLSPGAPAFFKLVKRQARGSVHVVLDYDTPSGNCTLNMYSPTAPDPVFSGVCTTFPPGSPFALQPVQDPRPRRELIPLIATDAYGFGGLNGYLVYPAGALQSGAEAPIGFSGHFTYTTTYVPPFPAAWPSRWIVGQRGPSFERCIYTGTLRVGAVSMY